MAVRKKGRRKIVCNDKNYVWYVALDYESPYMILHIISEDKKLVLCYPLETNYIVSLGRIFQGKNTDRQYHYYMLPTEPPEYITPKFESDIIAWATSDSNSESAVNNSKLYAKYGINYQSVCL